MSSKSRKHSDKTRKSRPRGDQADAGHAGESLAPASKEEEGLFSDELIHAPKEVSKVRYALTIALVIFLLLIFTIPGALMGGSGRVAGDDPVAMTWEVPGQGQQAILASEFQTAHRALADAVVFDPMLRGGLGITGRQVTAQDATRILALDRIALASGVRVTEDDLVNHLKYLLQNGYQGNTDVFQMALQRGDDVESTVRQCLRVMHFLQLAGYAGSVPTPEAIEELWNQQHVEVAFDYVVADAAAFEDAARAEVPADEELQTWFDQKPDWERAALNNPEQRGAQVALYRNAEATPAAALLAAFPPATPEPAEPVEGEEGAEPAPAPTAEDLALEYYNRVFTRRFLDPEAEEGSAGFLSFEDVKEQCLVEAPVQAALSAWLADLTQRQAAGEEVDFLAEATEYGLAFVEVQPGTRSDLMENEDLGDAMLVESIFATPDGSFAFAVTTTAQGLAVARVSERVEASLPPFEEIRDEVADMWIEPRQLELATESLEALYEGFEAYTPEEEEEPLFGMPPSTGEKRRAEEGAFTAAVEAAGYTPQRRDWKDRGAPFRPSASSEEDPDAAFFQRNFQSARMEEGQVSEPLPGTDRTTVYLVRCVGEREVPIERMSPGDYQQYRQWLAGGGGQRMTEALDLAFLESQFGLEQNVWDEESEAGTDEDAAEESAGAETSGAGEPEGSASEEAGAGTPAAGE